MWVKIDSALLEEQEFVSFSKESSFVRRVQEVQWCNMTHTSLISAASNSPLCCGPVPMLKLWANSGSSFCLLNNWKTCESDQQMFATFTWKGITVQKKNVTWGNFQLSSLETVELWKAHSELERGEILVWSEPVGASGDVNKYRWDRSTCLKWQEDKQKRRAGRGCGGEEEVPRFILDLPSNWPHLDHFIWLSPTVIQSFTSCVCKKPEEIETVLSSCCCERERETVVVVVVDGPI